MRALIIALLLSGCGTTGAVIGTPAPTTDGQRLIVDVTSGEVLTRERAVARLMAARHVYVGEQHGSATHHRVQLEVLEAMRSAGADLAIGIEWLPIEAQPAVDAWFSGAIDEEAFLKQADWKRNWGHAWDQYGLILRWARRHGVPVWALNVDRSVPKAVASHGPKYVSKAIKAKLPPMDTANEPHRRFFKAMMERVAHAHRGHKHRRPHKHHAPRKGHRHQKPVHKHPLLPKMERYYLAQVSRDETMAQTLARQLKATPARTAVVFAGLGHIDHGYGIPLRARKLLGEGFEIVLPVENNKMSEQGLLLNKKAYPAKRADLLWEAPPVGGASAAFIGRH